MKSTIIASLMGGLIKCLTPDVLKKGIDAFLDAIENSVTKSQNQIDDAVVLPLCKAIRDGLNIPDND